MKLKGNWVLNIFISVFCFVGCISDTSLPTKRVTINSASATPEAAPLTTTPTLVAHAATVTATASPTLTPFPTDTATHVPTISPPTVPPNTPTVTVTPSPTPTLYPDVWVAGLLWDEARTILYVGSSSGMIYDSRISYEPLDETVASQIANFPLGTLVVFYGDYTPLGVREGHMTVARVEQVNLPYTAATPLTMMYADPENRFSFAYPEAWSLTVEDEDNRLTLLNRPPENEGYIGPGIEYIDPTTIFLSIIVEEVSLETFVLNREDEERLGEDVGYDSQVKINVNHLEIGGQQVTQIDKESLMWGIYTQFVIPLNENAVIAFSSRSDSSFFAERLITTLSIP